MHFTETKISGVWLVELDRREDHRGFFARAWCQREYEDHGLNPRMVQVNIGFTTKRGGIRGLHFQLPPHEETKTIRCTMGALYDVAVDLRPQSPTYKQWIGVELTPETHCGLCIPEGCAHGYQTLADNTEMLYCTSAFYAAGSAGGYRYDDPAFGIIWPLPVSSISDADRSWPQFKELLAVGG
jgi:dTDP-4-dehydrorhamnose 3,5-epimerase